MNLLGKKCLITAGPTFESIDPVRFIGNRSSGKMGIELAREIGHKGAKIILILGPSNTKIENSEHIQVIHVESADEMYHEVMSHIENMDIGIFAAAVADYKPIHTAKEKIKKTGDTLILELVKTKDILSEVGNSKKEGQIIVGFALETIDEIENAKSKLVRKNLDMIVLNSLRDKGAGFQSDSNKITILDKYNNMTNFELKSKQEVAKDIVYYICDKF